MSNSKNHFTSELVYFFTNILTGGTTSPLTSTKYMSIYSMNAEEFVSRYNKNKLSEEIQSARLASSRVRISDTVTKDEQHYASFISTFNGLDMNLPSTVNHICLVLGSEDYMFVATDIDTEFFGYLQEGLRVDIDWKITLSSMIEEVQVNE